MTTPHEPTAEIVVFTGNPETLPKLEQVDADSLINQYLYMYTKGVELPFGDQNILVDHKNGAGNQCRIIVDRGQREPVYVVEFSERGSKRGYYRMKNGEMQVEASRQYLGLQEPETLLEELEGFFGTLDSEQLLASQFETAAYRNEVLYKNIGYFGSHGGGGTTFNMTAPKFYGGYKARRMRIAPKSEETPVSEPQEPFERKSTFEATQRDIEQRATDIITTRQWPEMSLDFVKRVLTGRLAGLTDKAIYRQLARFYHPDQTTLDKKEAEEAFKFIGQQLNKDTDGFTF